MELAINYDATVAKENFFETYKAKKQQLEKAMATWEEVQEALDALS